jgi:hypothetical protein
MNTNFKSFFGLSQNFEKLKIDNDKTLKKTLKGKKRGSFFIFVGGLVIFLNGFVVFYENFDELFKKWKFYVLFRLNKNKNKTILDNLEVFLYLLV